MRLQDAIEWAQECEAGDYLVTYDGWEAYSGTSAEDTVADGSRCGFGDDELAAIERVLRDRDMTLQADDSGLAAQHKEG